MANIAIIGSNRGIGLELVRQLVERGDHVHAACRTSSPTLDSLSGERVRVHSEIDVTDKTALARFAAALGPESLDGLVVVAGILERVGLERLDTDSIRRQFDVNALGPLQAVYAMQVCLREGAKVGLLTSRMGSIEDNTSGSSYGYRMSKAALNMAGKSLAIDLRDRGIAVVLLHPGWVRTEMTGGTGQIEVDEAAAGLIARLDELTLETTGSFLHQNGDGLPW